MSTTKAVEQEKQACCAPTGCGGDSAAAETKGGIVEAVQERYGAIARGERSGCGDDGETATAVALGYSAEEAALGEGANLGLGCGNPLALAGIEPGMTVLDLGSGAGFDAFLAWRKVGPAGRVIGVDMTDDMLARARENARKLGATNVEFRKGMIEKLPVEDASVDLVISNCVINLSTDKPAVFREIARVLKPGGRFAVSDIVLLGKLPERVARDIAAYVGCIAGASQLGEYVQHAVNAGLRDIEVPQVVPGKDLVSLIPSGGASCCSSEGSGCATPPADFTGEELRQAAAALASVKLHGRK